jgi:hypothetical protein
MKNFTNTILVAIAIFAVSFTSQANSKKVYNGYVITSSEEKLEGSIEMLSPSLNEVKVKFIGKDNKKTTFKAKEVSEYGFSVKKYNHKTKEYVNTQITYIKKSVERSPIAFGPKSVLIERQEAGAINMYNHFIEQNTNIEMPLVHVIYVEKSNNELVNVTKANYKNILKEMTAEYPELQARIGSRGHGFKHVSKIIASYNTWMVNNGEEVVLGMK